MDLESVLAAELNEIGDPAGPSLPKRKMLSDKNFGQSELLVEDTTGKLFGRHRCKGRRKFQQNDFVDPGGFETSQLFFRTGQVSKFDVRGENFHRMGLEREHERRPLRFSSRLHHGLQEHPMPEMMAVKIADGRDWMGTWTGIGEPTRHFQHRGQCRSRAASLAK
jgi:hypothetical protein